MDQSNFMLYVPLFSIFLFLLVAYTITPDFIFGSTTPNIITHADKQHNTTDELLFFGAGALIFLISVLISVQRSMKKLDEAKTKKEVMDVGFRLLVVSEVPALLGFVASFLLLSWIYLEIGVLISLVVWFYFYKQVEPKLQRYK